MRKFIKIQIELELKFKYFDYLTKLVWLLCYLGYLFASKNQFKQARRINLTLELDIFFKCSIQTKPNLPQDVSHFQSQFTIFHA